MTTIGVDIGGSKIVACVVEQGRVLARATALDVRYSPHSGPTRVALINTKVLSTACAASLALRSCTAVA